MLADVLIWGGYIALFIWLSRKGSGHDVMVSGRVGFGIQAFAYVATYISAVALVGFGGLAYAYGMQMLLVAAGNVWLGTWIVYRYLAWPTRLCQRNLQARTPVQLLANGHRSPLLGRCLALIFAVFLGVYASAVIKGAALLLAQIMPVPVWLLVWIVALLVAALNIANTMTMAIYERTKEIGIMKVIGASLKDIKGLFLTEAAFIGFSGGIIGIIVSYGASFLVNFVAQRQGSTMQSAIPIWLALGGIAFSTAVGVIAGYLPAKRAMKLSALMAIKTE